MRWHQASLRTRLAVGVMVLTALGLTVAAMVGTLILRSYLIGEVDHQLAGNSRFADGNLPQMPMNSSDPGSMPGQGKGQRPALPSPYVVTKLSSDGIVLEQVRGSQASGLALPDLAGLTVAAVQALAGRPFDVSGVGGGPAHYRAIAVPLADGSGSVVVATSTRAVQETVQRVVVAALGVGVVTLALVWLLSGVVIRVGLRPLDEVEATAERIAAGDLTQRVPNLATDTEIGRLSSSLNGMLGQIEQAFEERRASEDRLRRFVADASHELRTPLTTIRGYAELSRNGALGDEAQRLKAITRIEAEAVRMGTLVDDLLLLARLDQQRPLERRSVDIVALVDTAAEALRMAAPDREVIVSAPSTLTVEGDSARLRQVVDNLLANARIHTREGSPVEVTVTADAGTAVLSVSDSGPGMAAEDLARSTERFYRGDPSRSRRDGGGSGLGLAIARAIVEAHGGTLAIDSSPERGTTVTARIPSAPVLEGADAASARQ